MLDPLHFAELIEADIDLVDSESTVCLELIEAFARKATTVICSDNEVLFLKGEPGNCVYLVRSGEVRLLLPVSSGAGVGFRAKAGSLVGLPAAFSNQAYSMTAVALKGSELGMMSRDRFCDLIATNATLSLDVLRILAAETRAARLAITTHLTGEDGWKP